MPPSLQMFDGAKRKERSFVAMKVGGFTHVLAPRQPRPKRAGTALVLPGDREDLLDSAAPQSCFFPRQTGVYSGLEPHAGTSELPLSETLEGLALPVQRPDQSASVEKR